MWDQLGSWGNTMIKCIFDMDLGQWRKVRWVRTINGVQFSQKLVVLRVFSTSKSSHSNVNIGKIYYAMISELLLIFIEMYYT